MFHVATDSTNFERIMKEAKKAVNAIACHPQEPLVAAGSHCGLLKVWDYKDTQYLVSRIFTEAGIQCLSYDPEGIPSPVTSPRAKHWPSCEEKWCRERFLVRFPGYLLAAGFTDGSVYILDAISLQSICDKFQFSKGPVTHISFSYDSKYLATAVSLFFPLGDLHALFLGQLGEGLGVAGHSARHRANRAEGCPSPGAW